MRRKHPLVHVTSPALKLSPKDIKAVQDLRVDPDLFAHVFELELHGWHTVESRWPKDRSSCEFNRWFNSELHTVVDDLCADPLLDDDHAE